MIIIEGPDNSGKTTLARTIQAMARWNGKLEISHSPGPVRELYDFLMQSMKKPPEYMAGHIADRFFLSELAYQPVFRPNDQLLSAHQKNVVVSMLWTMAPLVIICHFDKNQERYDSKEQRFSFEKMDLIKKEYNKLSIKSLTGAWRVVHFYIGDPVENIVSIANEYLEFAREKWIPRRRLLPYGRGNLLNTNRVKLVLVGQGFARNNVWKVPFERSKSGQMIQEVLNWYMVEQEFVWWTNAHKYNNLRRNLKELETERMAFRETLFVALGREASKMLRSVGVPCWSVKHPGYYLRRGTREDFLEEMKRPLESVSWK